MKRKKKISSFIRNNLVTGIFVLAPIAAVAWIVLKLWAVLFAIVTLVPEEFRPTTLFHLNALSSNVFDFLLTLVVFILILFLIGLAGFFSRYYLGKKVLRLIRKIFAKVPVVSTIYSTLEQLLETFSGGKTKNFRKVVQIEYPRKGIFTLAFVTGEQQNGTMLSIFVPTTPNPTSGFYLMIPAEDAREMALSVEDALKEIISMGLVRKEPFHG